MASKTYRFVNLNHIKRLYVSLIANAAPIQPGLLDSAVASPANVKHYSGQDNLFQLAANLSEKIMKNHAFQDGNKRAALVAADLFLKINGYRLRQVPVANSEGLADAHVKVTTNEWSTEQLGSYYESVATPIDALSPTIEASRNEAPES